MEGGKRSHRTKDTPSSIFAWKRGKEGRYERGREGIEAMRNGGREGERKSKERKELKKADKGR